MDREQVESYIEGDCELDEITENTFKCPHCSTPVPTEIGWCVECEKSVEPESN
jgi:hypothetical protein